MKKILSVVLSLVLVLALASTASAATTLRKGSKGTLVKKVQELMNAGGYGDLTVDGVYGTGTIAAVKRYQSANGLTADGLCGTKTLKSLGLYPAESNPTGDTDDDDDTRVVQYGSVGATVKAIQSQLASLGYPVGKADGTYGAKTRTAVRYFQQRNNLTVDGKVGPSTYAVLMSGSAAPYSASSTSTYTKLSKNSSGTLVKKLQTALYNQGYLTYDQITSFYGTDTVNAVKAFQTASGLTVDGVAGALTQAALYGDDYNN